MDLTYFSYNMSFPAQAVYGIPKGLVWGQLLCRFYLGRNRVQICLICVCVGGDISVNQFPDEKYAIICLT